MTHLDHRLLAILSSSKPGAAPQVRTSEAFAERFRAEADRSGLTVDLAPEAIEAKVRICAICGAQNGRFETACFNCQSDLPAAPPAQEKQQPQRREPDATRWLNITRVAAPLNVRVPLNAARFTPYTVENVQPQHVLNRFLSVFVERAQEQHTPPKSVARFDERSVFDKFLSVFVERQ